MAAPVPSRFAPSVLACAVAALSLGPSHAWADEQAAMGRIMGVHINSPGSELYATYHGAISVRREGGKVEQYQWGGTLCPTTELNPETVALLAQAFHHRYRTQVQVQFRPGEVTNTRCLVAFELVAG